LEAWTRTGLARTAISLQRYVVGKVRDAPNVKVSATKQDVPSIGPEEAGKLVMAAKAAFLDVRTSSAFAAEHVAGAFNVPWLLEADSGALEVGTRPDPAVLIPLSCGRSSAL
jgi:hypothetical protein